MDAQSDAQLDYRVRHFVYDAVLTAGQIPTLASTAAALNQDPVAVRGAFQRLAAGRVLVLQENDEILMANPFSAVPTPFVVTSSGRSWWGNCIWDALGIVALLRQDSIVQASCGDCGTAMELRVVDGQLAPADGIIHIGVPARRWWENIVYT